MSNEGIVACVAALELEGLGLGWLPVMKILFQLACAAASPIKFGVLCHFLECSITEWSTAKPLLFVKYCKMFELDFSKRQPPIYICICLH